MRFPQYNADWDSPVNSNQVKHKSARIWRRPLGSPITRPNQYPQAQYRVERGEQSGVVTFSKQAGVWIVVGVPVFLTYLRGMRAADFKIEIEGDGWKWERLT